MDNISLQENTTVASDDMSVLYHVRYTPGYPRFIYGVYLILSIIFYGIGIYTALNILVGFLNDGTVLTFGTVLFLCYALLNGIIGHGFMFHKKWLLVAFSSDLILIGLLALFFFMSGAAPRGATLLMSMFIIAGILLFLFLMRHLLSDRYLEPKVIIPFVAILLFSLLLTNFGMLH